MRKDKEPVSPDTYQRFLADARLPPDDAFESDWSIEFVSRFVYTVLFQCTKAGSESRRTLRRVKDKDGFEALRQLHKLRDPLELNTTAVKSEDITIAAANNAKCWSD